MNPYTLEMGTLGGREMQPMHIHIHAKDVRELEAGRKLIDQARRMAGQASVLKGSGVMLTGLSRELADGSRIKVVHNESLPITAQIYPVFSEESDESDSEEKKKYEVEYLDFPFLWVGIRNLGQDSAVQSQSAGDVTYTADTALNISQDSVAAKKANLEWQEQYKGTEFEFSFPFGDADFIERYLWTDEMREATILSVTTIPMFRTGAGLIVYEPGCTPSTTELGEGEGDDRPRVRLERLGHFQKSPAGDFPLLQTEGVNFVLGQSFAPSGAYMEFSTPYLYFNEALDRPAYIPVGTQEHA
ncbi:MAG: hypothetical protein AB8B85_02655, partial [Paracoccaceae bacterium]